jgi:hypothetical protein
MMQIPNANTGGKAKVDFPLIAPSMYPAYLTRVVGLGTQVKKGWEGAPDTNIFKINFSFEVCGHSVEDAEGNTIPRMMFKNGIPIYSKADKGGAFDIGRAFKPEIANTQNMDWLGLAGSPCMIQVGQYTDKKDGSTKNCVNAVMPPLSGMPMPDIQGEVITFNPYADDDGSGLYDWEIRVLSEALDADKLPINGSADEKPPFKDAEPSTEDATNTTVIL